MKQVVVVKVSMNEHKKARSKALKIAVSLSGVESAALQGPDKDQIAVTGEGIDSVQLTTLLRKNVGHTELLTVGPVEEKKNANTDNNNKATTQNAGSIAFYGHSYAPPLHIYEVPSYTDESSCSIM